MEGQVVNRLTKEPLRKVAVRLLQGNRSFEASTDTAGVFRIQNLQAGTYRVMAERAGFVRGGGSRSSATVALSAGQKLEGFLIELTPQAVVAGRVTDEDGDPMMSATVQLWQVSYRRGKKQLAQVEGAGTNDLGEFRLAGINAGRYYLSATRSRRGSASGDVDYVTHYWPGALEPASAGVIELTAGQQMTNVEMRLARVGVARIRGQVHGAPASGARGGGVMVFLHPADPMLASSDRRPVPVNPKDGSFEIRGARPGAYTLVAMQSGRGQQMSARLEMTVPAGLTDGVELTLQPGIRVTGQFGAEGEAPAWKGVSVQLIPEDSWKSPSGARAGEDGAFAAQEVLSAGRYRIVVQGLPEGYWLKSARFGSQEVYPAGLELAAASAAELQIVVASGAGRVEGLVRNGRSDPAAGAYVVLAPDDAARRWPESFRTGPADAGGSFRFTNLAPGRYRLLAFEELEQGAYQDPELWVKFSHEAQRVEISQNGRASAELRQVPAEALGAR